MDMCGIYYNFVTSTIIHIPYTEISWIIHLLTFLP